MTQVSPLYDSTNAEMFDDSDYADIIAMGNRSYTLSKKSTPASIKTKQSIFHKNTPSSSFDSHGTTKEAGAIGTGPGDTPFKGVDVSAILKENKRPVQNLKFASQPPSPRYGKSNQSPGRKPYQSAPDEYLPRTVLTDNKTPIYPETPASALSTSTSSFDKVKFSVQHGQPTYRFYKSHTKKADSGSEATEEEAERRKRSLAKKRASIATPEVLTRRPTDLDRIRREVAEEQRQKEMEEREKVHVTDEIRERRSGKPRDGGPKAREGRDGPYGYVRTPVKNGFSYMRVGTPGKDAFSVSRTPQARPDNVFVPTDHLDAELFEQICQIQEKFEASQGQVSELKKTIREMQTEAESNSQRCSSLENEVEVARRTIQKLEDAHEAELAHMAGDHKAKVARLGEQHAAELSRLGEQHATLMDQLMQQHETQLGQMSKRHESYVSKMSHESQTATSSHEAATAQLCEQVGVLEQQKADLEARLKQQTRDLDPEHLETQARDLEHYKNQCYSKDKRITDLEQQIVREGKLEEFAAEIEEREKRLRATELRLGQQAVDQDQLLHDLESQKKRYKDKEDKGELLKKLAMMEGRENGFKRPSRARKFSYNGGSSDSDSDCSVRSRNNNRHRQSRSSTSTSTSTRKCSGGSHCSHASSAMRSDAWDKLVEFIHTHRGGCVSGSGRMRQNASQPSYYAHMDGCYNVVGGAAAAAGVKPTFTPSEHKAVEKILDTFLSKDDTELADLLYHSEGGKLDKAFNDIYDSVAEV